MGMSVRVQGGTQLHTLRQTLREVGDRGLGTQLSRGLRRASQKFQPEVRAEVPKAMPSGYAPTLARSLRFRTQIQESRSTARVLIRVYADGRKERRDVPTLNRGRLRHPVFGRRGNWVDQRVRRGFVDRPVDRLGPEVAREMQTVVDWVADQIRRG